MKTDTLSEQIAKLNNQPCWQCQDRDSGKMKIQIVDIMSCGHSVCSLCGKQIPSKEDELVHSRMFSKCFKCK